MVGRALMNKEQESFSNLKYSSLRKHFPTDGKSLFEGSEENLLISFLSYLLRNDNLGSGESCNFLHSYILKSYMLLDGILYRRFHELLGKSITLDKYPQGS